MSECIKCFQCPQQFVQCHKCHVMLCFACATSYDEVSRLYIFYTKVNNINTLTNREFNQFLKDIRSQPFTALLKNITDKPCPYEHTSFVEDTNDEYIGYTDVQDFLENLFGYDDIAFTCNMCYLGEKPNTYLY